MDYFRVKSINQLSDLHNQSYSNASNSTKSTFLQSLKRIEKLYNLKFPDIKLSFIENPEELIKKMDESNYSENTKLTTITNILKLLKIVDVPLITYNHWLTILKDKTEDRHARDADKLKDKLSVLVDFKLIRQSSSRYRSQIRRSRRYGNGKIQKLPDIRSIQPSNTCES